MLYQFINEKQRYWLVKLCVILLFIQSILPIVSIHKVTALEATNDWQRIAAGRYHSLALTPDRGVVAWGSNGYGRTTVPKEAKANIVSVSAGQDHSLALTSTGKVIAWGGGRFNEAVIPEEVNDNEIISVMSGPVAFHSLALSSEGEVFAWGNNSKGQSTVPARAKHDIVSIAAGYWHSLALTSTGEVIAWGDDGYGQSTVPDDAKSGIVAISAGGTHSLTLTSTGRVIAWGDDNYGQSTVPSEAKSNVVAISAGDSHSLALTADGEVVAWGSDNEGQSTVPSEAKSNVVAISAGDSHSLALKADGTIIAWGSDGYGQSNIPTSDLTSIEFIDQKGREFDIQIDSNEDKYTVFVDQTVSSVNIRAELEKPDHAVVFINGQKQTDLSRGIDIDLKDDQTSVEVKVSPYFTEGKTYTLTIEKAEEPIISFTPNGNENWLQQASTQVSVEHADPNESLLYAWLNSALHPEGEITWTSFQNGDTIQTPIENGEWYLHVRALNLAGSEKIASSNRFRLDNTPPTLTLLGDNPMNLLYGESFDDPGYEVTDNVDVDIKNKVVVEGEVHSTKVGTYTLTYYVEDSAGNSTTVTRTVHVNDEDQPVITLKGDNPLVLEVGTPYEEPGATAEDNVDGDISDQIEITGEVNTKKLGIYEVRYNVIDSSGNQAQETVRTVKVVDTTAPTNVKLVEKDTTTNSVILAFSAHDARGIKEYVLSRDGKEIATIDGNKSIYTDKGLEPDKTYTYQLVAVDFSGNQSKAVDLHVTTQKEKIRVQEISKLSDITVAYGTALKDIPLPKEVTVTLSNGETIKVPVTWNEGKPTYDEKIVGIYSFTGDIRLPEGIENQDKYKATINVIVETPETTEIHLNDPATMIYPGSTVIVKGTDTSIQLPNNLPKGTLLRVESFKNINTQGFKQVGEMYRFIFIYPNGQEGYTGEFILTMGVEHEVENAAIYYYNEQTDIWDYIGGDIEDSQITATVNHFSTYGVLMKEIVESDDEADQSSVDQDKVGDGDNDNIIIENEEKQDQNDGKLLPRTATNYYNWLFIGSLLIILTIVIWQVNRRRNHVE